MFNFFLILFLICVLAILHTYLFYPLGLMLFSKKSKALTVYHCHDVMPQVTILMAVYNEENVLNEKIQSVINTGYPFDKLLFLIGSDASTDKTNQIIKSWSIKYPFIHLHEFAARTGKAGIINELVKLSNTDLLILTDANVIFTKDTIINLIRHFANGRVGQVCSNIIKVSESHKGISQQEKNYMAIENKIKLYESLTWNVVMGAEGGCNAIRKKNYAVVPPNFCVDDFYISMNVIEQDMEIVFEKDAVCFEDAPSLSSVEFSRKVRISTGNFQNLFRYKKMLFTFWKGASFAFLSHKVLRWLTPFLLLICFFTSLALSFYCKIFIFIALLQLIGCLSPIFKTELKYFKTISHFYLMNLALLTGFFKYLSGVETNIWQPTKRNV